MSEQEGPGTESRGEGAADSESDTAKTIADLEDSWRRTAAELDNFRKRCARDVIGAREQERASAASRWLPVLDNLERALEHASSEPGQIVEGVRSVYQQALAVLAGMGYPRRDDETGTPFDPGRHEAVGTVADAHRIPGTVAHVIRPGYGPDSEILRPASVIVATRGD
jgi:molecular chaperone GrpE